jgi:hypothetical protein
VAKEFLRLSKLQNLKELSEFREIKRFLEQVNESLPFLPQPIDLVSPSEKILNTISHVVEPEMIKRQRDINVFFPQIALIFAVSNLNEFLLSKQEILKKINSCDIHGMIALEIALSLWKDSAQKESIKSRKMFLDLTEVLVITQTILRNGVRRSRKISGIRGQPALSRSIVIDVNPSKVARYIERIEEFGRLVNKMWV